MRRRTFAGMLGSIAAGTAGYGLLTQESEAVAVGMTVYGDSGELGGETIEDTVTISVKRRQASVETTLSADGSISISTKTPA